MNPQDTECAEILGDQHRDALEKLPAKRKVIIIGFLQAGVVFLSKMSHEDATLAIAMLKEANEMAGK